MRAPCPATLPDNRDTAGPGRIFPGRAGSTEMESEGQAAPDPVPEPAARAPAFGAADGEGRQPTRFRLGGGVMAERRTGNQREVARYVPAELGPESDEDAPGIPVSAQRVRTGGNDIAGQVGVDEELVESVFVGRLELARAAQREVAAESVSAEPPEFRPGGGRGADGKDVVDVFGTELDAELWYSRLIGPDREDVAAVTEHVVADGVDSSRVGFAQTERDVDRADLHAPQPAADEVELEPGHNAVARKPVGG